MTKKIFEYLKSIGVISNNNSLNVDFLGLKPTEFSIMKMEVEPVIERYINGSTLRQYQFELVSCNEYGIDVIQNMNNSNFYDNLCEVIEENNRKHNLPEIDGIESIECLNNGGILNSQTNKAKYSIQMRITYYKEAK